MIDIFIDLSEFWIYTPNMSPSHDYIGWQSVAMQINSLTIFQTDFSCSHSLVISQSLWLLSFSQSEISNMRKFHEFFFSFLFTSWTSENFFVCRRRSPFFPFGNEQKNLFRFHTHMSESVCVDKFKGFVSFNVSFFFDSKMKLLFYFVFPFLSMLWLSSYFGSL